MSTVEAEYVSLSACCAQVIWMRTQLLDYGFRYTKIPIYFNSQSAIAISCNPVQHSRIKHVNIRYHFIKELVEKGTIELYFVGTKYQLADLFTKALPKERFEYLVHRTGMRCMTPTELERLANIPHGSTSNSRCSACSRYHTIRRFNNYVMLQRIPCSPECKIVGQKLLDHPLSYALTATTGVPVDDTPLVSVYTTRNVLVRGILIPAEFFTKEIRATDDFKEYKTVFDRVDVPINQPQLVVATQGMHKSTPRAHRIPTISTASPQGKKRKQTAGESSSPRKSQKITIRKKKQSLTPIPPPGDDRERDEVAKATILSLALHKTALVAEAQENIAKLQEKLYEDEIEKMVEGNEDEDSYASEFADSMIIDDVDDSGTKIETERHKEHPNIVNDDDDQIEKEKNDVDIEIEKKDEEIVMKKR
ncbi:hypothetical protein Tco_1577075 [Tanacetum coccineum]